jgi:hypothetical protein
MVSWLKEFGPELGWLMQGKAEFEARVIEHDGRRYVRVDEKTTKDSTIYRVTNQGQLRRMRRPPKDLPGE